MKFVPFIDEHRLLSPAAVSSDRPWFAEACLRGISDPAGLVLLHESAAGHRTGKLTSTLVTILRHVLVSLDRTQGCTDASIDQKLYLLKALIRHVRYLQDCTATSAGTKPARGPSAAWMPGIADVPDGILCTTLPH